MSTARFIFSHSAPSEIYTLSLHDALPISIAPTLDAETIDRSIAFAQSRYGKGDGAYLNCPMNEAEYRAVEVRSEEHTSELQSRPHIVCRLLLVKKNRWANSISYNIHHYPS